MKYRRNLPLAHGHFILLNNTISKRSVVLVVGYLKRNITANYSIVTEQKNC